MSTRRRLFRSRRRRVLGGVCGGLAERFGWNVTLLRAAFLLGSLVPILPGALAYLVLWILVPLEKRR